jgi:hypothetical protein
MFDFIKKVIAQIWVLDLISYHAVNHFDFVRLLFAKSVKQKVRESDLLSLHFYTNHVNPG